MGTDESEIMQLMTRYPNLPRDVFEPEIPRHLVHLRAFGIDRYEVTNEQYREFLLANPSWQPTAVPAPQTNGSYLKGWTDLNFPAGEARRPVTPIAVGAAVAFRPRPNGSTRRAADWRGRNFPGAIRLPRRPAPTGAALR